jgi:uncharacterized protein (TIGR02597 family)
MKLHRLPLLAAATSLAFAPALLNAQTTVATDPVGFVTTTIKASTTPGAPANTPLSPVLLALSAVTGSTAGQLSSVSASDVTVASAGWTTSELVSSQAYLLFKSGALSGLILRVTANTATTATLDTLGASLVSLGAAAGDSYQLVQGDTLSSMFDDSNNDSIPDGVVGGTQAQFQAGQTDRVTTRDTAGTVRSYYFNTQFNQWRRLGSNSNQGTVPIAPTSGVMYARIGNTPITLVTTGNVPVSAVKFLVPTSGQTYFARYFPTDGTINSFGFQNLSGWKGTNTPGVTISGADKIVTTDVSGTIRQYYWTGTQWRRQGSATDQSATPVPIGGSVSVIRTGSGEPQLLSFNVPYTL